MRDDGHMWLWAGLPEQRDVRPWNRCWDEILGAGLGYVGLKRVPSQGQITAPERSGTDRWFDLAS